MKNLYTYKVNFLLKCFVLLFVILFGDSYIANAQVIKPFTQRTSQYSTDKKIYNIKGDFTMIGNTNLTLQDYSDSGSNSSNMRYVDVDGDSNTWNSSSANLNFSTENGANPSCSNIVYAGLYWTGRASNGSSSPESFDVTKTNQLIGTQPVNATYNSIGHNNNITNTDYSLSISRQGSSGSRFVRYTFTGGTGQPTVEFEFSNSSSYIRYRISGGSWISPTNQSVSNSGDNRTVIFDPVTIYSASGGITLTIDRLVRDSRTSESSNTYQGSSFARATVVGDVPQYGSVTKTFNKRVISIKGPNSSAYTQLTANPNDIHYPVTGDGMMYSGYVEVTNYVRNNGIGNYSVADIALAEGNGGDTGFYGGWGLVVVYENSKMKWRDVTVFDGHSYVAGSVTADWQIPVSGFHTAQSGAVNMKLGMIAGEGDRSIGTNNNNSTGVTSRDYFEIRNHQDTNWISLNHTGNFTNNFFNSSIATGGNTRNPNLLNNTGLDISMFNIPNASNSVVTNNQTSTTFRYGTTQDTFVIFNITMSVDAYVPEVETILTSTTINGTPSVQPYTVLPGQEMGFTIDIKNLGTEAVNNYKLIIPIPYNASYVPGSANGNVIFSSPIPTPNNVYFDPLLGATGSIVWDFGTLPLPANINDLLAQLTFKLKATTDCGILNNANCASVIGVTGTSTGVGANTSTNLNTSNLIQGYSQNGTCVGEPIPTPLNINIYGADYVSANCPNTNVVRNFAYCGSNSSVAISEIASNFPPGSLFYNEFPVDLDSVQYTNSNPIPLVAGSTITYFAVPPGGGNSCNFPFTISKCKAIIAQDDTFSGINGVIGNPNVGNVFNDNGNGSDTLNGTQTNTSQVSLTIVTPANPINGNPNIPVINPNNGQISVPPGTPSGTYTITYQICENGSISNCDSAVVIITVVCPTVAQPEKVNCWDDYQFNTESCTWVNEGTQPTQPTAVNCWDDYQFNTESCNWVNEGTQPAQPTDLECYQTVGDFNTTTCAWNVTGTAPVAEVINDQDRCNEAEEDEVDLLSLLPLGTPQNGTWEFNGLSGINGTVFNPFGVTMGDYTVSYSYNDGSVCPKVFDINLAVISECAVLACENIVVHNAFTPNGDGVNEHFQIDNIDQECHLPNRVEIFNRWGRLVYETDNYDNNTRKFTGVSEGKVTVDKNAELPTGTYFYIIHYNDGNGKAISKSDYLYLTR